VSYIRHILAMDLQSIVTNKWISSCFGVISSHFHNTHYWNLCWAGWI